MLTARQLELYRFIENTMARKGAAPSFREMRDAMGLKSGSGIHRLLAGLEERGFIRRLPCRARAIEIVHRRVRSASIDLINALPLADSAEAEREQIMQILNTAERIWGQPFTANFATLSAVTEPGYLAAQQYRNAAARKQLLHMTERNQP